MKVISAVAALLLMSTAQGK